MFKSKVVKAVGTDVVTIQTVPAGNVHMVLSVFATNKLTTDTLVAAQVQVVKTTGEVFNLIDVKPPLISGEMKLWEGKIFLEAGDSIKTVADNAASLDVMTNYVEDVNS